MLNPAQIEFNTPFVALRDKVLAEANVENIDIDNGAYSDELLAAYKKLDDENYDFLADIGMLSYHLVVTGETIDDRKKLRAFCAALLKFLVAFNIAEERLDIEE